MRRTLKLVIAFIMVLHFTGVNQLLSSYAKDKASFVNMLSMTEEENKKEKDDKEDDSEFHLIRAKYTLSALNSFYGEKMFGFALAAEDVAHQFIADHQSPPPDFNG